jgi:hypothetical protein
VGLDHLGCLNVGQIFLVIINSCEKSDQHANCWLGWGSFVLKEKFKLIKLALKELHGAHSQNLPSRIDSLKVRLSVLEGKGEEEDLSEAELEELHGLTSDIHSLSRRNANICW